MSLNPRDDVAFVVSSAKDNTIPCGTLFHIAHSSLTLLIRAMAGKFRHAITAYVKGNGNLVIVPTICGQRN